MAKTKYKKQFAEDLLRYFFKFIEMRDDPEEGDAAERRDLMLMEPGVDGVYKTIPPKPASGYPTLTKFAIMKGVTIQTLINWRKKYKEFEEACAFAEEIQRDVLEERALTCQWDSKTAMKIIELRAAQKRESAEEFGNHIQITFKNLTKPTIELKEQEGITSEDTGYIDER